MRPTFHRCYWAWANLGQLGPRCAPRTATPEIALGVVMEWLQNLALSDPETVKGLIQAFWIVPAGMVALYFYGRSHFNTPDYALGAQQGAPAGHLLTLAPPIFTTYRSQYNRYALTYVIILETVFLAFIFLTSVFTDMAAIMKLRLPELGTETVQFRALLALFCLTGLLSSFPGFKDLDAFILRKLHKAALIPDDARLLASHLFDAPFVPHPEAAATVKAALISRDTIRVAEGKATGLFESNVLKALCMLNQLQHKIANSKYNYFKVKLERDLNDVASRRETLKPAFIAYLKEQASVVPDSVFDIDQYLLETADDPRIAQLLEKRKENLAKCNDLLYRLCLVVALLSYATKFTPEAVSDALNDLGFKIDVRARRIMDWDAVFRVTLGVFLTMLVFNALFAVLVNFGIMTAPISLNRQTTLGFALVTTLFYFIALMIAIRLKRYWHRDPELYRDKPENVLASLYSYLAILPFTIALSLWIRHGQLSYTPFLFALNQGVAAYFIGIYVDRSLNDLPVDWRLPGWQGLAQGVTAFGVITLAQPVPGDVPSFAGELERALFFAFQSGAAGFLMGFLFQKYYRRTKSVSGAALGDIALQPRPA
jgi:hypothetical protein